LLHQCAGKTTVQKFICLQTILHTDRAALRLDFSDYTRQYSRLSEAVPSEDNWSYFIDSIVAKFCGDLEVLGKHALANEMREAADKAKVFPQFERLLMTPHASELLLAIDEPEDLLQIFHVADGKLIPFAALLPRVLSSAKCNLLITSTQLVDSRLALFTGGVLKPTLLHSATPPAAISVVGLDARTSGGGSQVRAKPTRSSPGLLIEEHCTE
jgi:hypothetical protein